MQRSRRRILIAWNGRAGGSTRHAGLRERLRAEPQVTIRPARSRREMVELARDAASGGVDLLLAAGGDGTLSAAAEGLLGSSLPLGVLPLGSANDVARSWGVPLDPWQAFMAQRVARSRPYGVLDVRARGTGRIALNVVTGANGARVTQRATRSLKRRWGAGVYLRAALDVLADLERWDVSLRIDDAPPKKLRLLAFAAANGPRAGGGLTIAPRADPSDGRIELVMMKDASAAAIARVAARLVLADRVDGDAVIAVRCRRVDVSSRTPFPLSADGDPLRPARRFSIGVRRGALRVVDLRTSELRRTPASDAG